MKNKKITVRLSEDEYIKYNTMAKKKKMNKTQFFKHKIFENDDLSRKEIIMYLEKFSKNNLGAINKLELIIASILKNFYFDFLQISAANFRFHESDTDNIEQLNNAETFIENLFTDILKEIKK